MNRLPKITVVTPSYQQGHFIRETIDSVLNQHYDNLEYIVIDGGSQDNTVKILKEYSSKLHYWVSEADNGQSHALNKGFAKATGDICYYLNSDDILFPNVLAMVASKFLESKPVWLAGSVRVGTTMLQTTLWKPCIGSYAQFVSGMTVPQQGVFWLAKSIPRPYFDPDRQYTMDHDLFIRIMEIHGAPLLSADEFAFFRQHPSTKTSQMSSVLIREALENVERALARAKNSSTRRDISKQLIIQRWRASLNTLMSGWTNGEHTRAFVIKQLVRSISLEPRMVTDRYVLGVFKRLVIPN